MKTYVRCIFSICYLLFIGCSTSYDVDLLITNAEIYDGSGSPSYLGQVGVKDGKIVYVGIEKPMSAAKTVDAKRKILAPGFINMLSWGYDTLLEDGRSLSDLKQGVTLEVFGEGTSPGPSGKRDSTNYQTFGQAMSKLEKNGISTNIASYLGATSVRIQTVGYENRPASEQELEEMKRIVVQSMEEGALGIGS